MTVHTMNRLRRLVPSPAANAPASAKQAPDVFRRFFALIGRYERPRSDARPAPETKARITRLDADPQRNA